MHADGGGLYLQVTAGKDEGQVNKSWLFRFARVGRERQMGLGSLNTIGLAEARAEAEQCRKLLREGKRPHRAEGRITGLRKRRQGEVRHVRMVRRRLHGRP
jgi:hypothetical protein